MLNRIARLRAVIKFVATAFLIVSLAPAAPAQSMEFRQAVAEAAANDADLVAFYRERNFAGIWATRADRNRRNALLSAFNSAADHGLPANQYDADALIGRLQAASTPQEQGRLEVELTRQFLDYARDVQTGVLIPSRIDSAIHRQIPLRSRVGTLRAFAQSNPAGFIRSLPPQSPEYTRLMREKIAMERLLADGGWGPTVPGGKLERGASGQRVVALRNRLIAMGFLGRTTTQTYDDAIFSAVQQFQLAHGLATDGTAGPGTLEQINVSPERRLQSIIVAMERERWINRPRGERHVWVNITDFTAKIIDNGVETFSTRSVVGARASDRVTPEFSDVMEFMIINPSWYVPRSIITKEYLPQLQANPNAARNLLITDSRGRVVDRSTADFSGYTANNFPYSMREPPSQGNALGLVKFMFPNRHNIYLHDTPSKSLFGREVRAYSHGCVRLADPFDFAYALLARQTSDPQGFFQSRLRTGREQRVDLADPVPVHLIYRTAYTQAEGRTQYRRDIYGRDGRIWNALAREGWLFAPFAAKSDLGIISGGRMAQSVKDIAAALGAEAFGAVDLLVDGASEPAAAGPNDLALAMTPVYGDALAHGNARAAVVWPGADWQALGLEAAIIAPRARLAMAGLTQMLDRPLPGEGISPHAAIDPSAQIGKNVTIGAFTVIGPDAVIGGNTWIADQVSIAQGVQLGAGCQIHAGARLRRGTRLGARVILQSNAAVGGDGFSFVTAEPSNVELARETLGEGEIKIPDDPTWHRIHSLGGVEIGDDVEVGANSCVDAGTIRATRIGVGTKIDSLVQVGHNVIVGEHCLLCAQAGVAGSTVIGDRVVVGGKAGVADNLIVGDDVVLGGGSVVLSNVPKGRVMMGYPATKMQTHIEGYKALRRLPRTLRDLAKR